jgi:intermediate peptidase
LCRSAHSSQDWRASAEQAFGELQDHIGALNTDVALYNTLAVILEKHNKGDFTLSPEEERFCILLKREFELDGIHLPDDKRQHVRQLHSQVTTLESLFMNNITNQSQKLFAVDADLVHQVIPKHVLIANGATYGDKNNNNLLQLATDTPITHSIQSFAPSGELRKQVYMECMTTVPENIDVLVALRDARHHLARSLNFESYAHRFLQDKMAQTPQNVQEFLKDLHKRIQPFYEKDLQILQHAKQQVENSPQIEPWDVKFYVKLLKSQAGVDPNELAPYLSLSNTLEATQLLVQRLFGIHMEEQDILPAERWDITEHDRNPRHYDIPKDEQIRKFFFTEEDTGRQLGTMYLDLHPRPGKYTHAAHFTVRCGCRTGGPNSEEYQQPIVALVCNMNSGQASFSSHQEVETFLHEFGHAMHSLLSRTNFQHLSGTRASMDFVETPSHWMEHYAWCEDFFPLLTKNAQREPIPREMMQALVKSRNQFRFLEMQNQIVLASFDQILFGPQHNTKQHSPTHVWEAIHRQNGVPFASGTHWFTNVGHLVTYGAGYYGYLYSQVFATGIWNQLFRNQSMKREVGQRLWKELLAHGGARDPNLMLEDLLGQKPTVDNYWNSIV